MSEAAARPWWAEVEHLREQALRREGAPLVRMPAAGTDDGRQQRTSSEAAPRARRERETDRRRTVKIRGQAIPTVPAARLRIADEQAAPLRSQPQPLVTARARRRRPPPRTAERVHARPDRLALWAFLLALVLVAVAATSAHGATPAPSHAPQLTHAVVRATHQP